MTVRRKGVSTPTFDTQSHLQNSGWMSGNPTLSPFSGWNEVHGGSMDRNFSPEMGQSGEADRRSRVLQVAPQDEYYALIATWILRMLLGSAVAFRGFFLIQSADFTTAACRIGDIFIWHLAMPFL